MKKSHGIALSVVAVGNFLVTILLYQVFSNSTAQIAVLMFTVLIIGYTAWRLENEDWTHAVANTVWEDIIRLFSLIYILIGTLIAVVWVQERASALLLALYAAVVVTTIVYFYKKKPASQRLINET